jgi:hypothetical protein
MVPTSWDERKRETAIGVFSTFARLAPSHIFSHIKTLRVEGLNYRQLFMRMMEKRALYGLTTSIAHRGLSGSIFYLVRGPLINPENRQNDNRANLIAIAVQTIVTSPFAIAATHTQKNDGCVGPSGQMEKGVWRVVKTLYALNGLRGLIFPGLGWRLALGGVMIIPRMAVMTPALENPSRAPSS